MNEYPPVSVSAAWLRLVLFCQSEFPEGEMRLKIVGGQPTELLEAKRRVRFDKGPIPAYTASIIEQTNH